MSGWRHEAFDNVIADESGGNLKTPQSEFLPSGRYAIVDQGKELVAGYTNDESRLCHAQLPVIVFGDHTRCFKYVDFPFCMGADGVKVLRPKVEADVKYLYHYLRQVRLTEGGYDRHFKYLKRISIPLPPLPEQRRIAEILDKADALRAKRRAAVAQLDTLTQSIFLDMFGDPATNPKGWPIRRFDETMRDETSRAEKLQRSDYLPEGRYPVVDQGQSIIAGYSDDERYLCPSEPPVVVFGDHTRAVKLVRHPFVVGADGAKVLAPQPGVDATFLSYLLSELPIPDLGYSRHMREVKRLAFPVPPTDCQKEFAQRVAGVELHRATQERSLLEIDALFASLQHRAFRGEL